MNEEFVSEIEKISDSDEIVFSIGHNTFFTHDGDKTVVRYCTDKGTAELQLRTIEEMCEGNSPFQSTNDNWMDIYLPLLMAIGSAIDRFKSDNPDLRDKDLFPILERLIMKPDINLNHAVPKTIQDRIQTNIVHKYLLEKRSDRCAEESASFRKNPPRCGRV